METDFPGAVVYGAQCGGTFSAQNFSGDVGLNFQKNVIGVKTLIGGVPRFRPRPCEFAEGAKAALKPDNNFSRSFMDGLEFQQALAMSNGQNITLTAL